MTGDFPIKLWSWKQLWVIAKAPKISLQIICAKVERIFLGSLTNFQFIYFSTIVTWQRNKNKLNYLFVYVVDTEFRNGRVSCLEFSFPFYWGIFFNAKINLNQDLKLLKAFINQSFYFILTKRTVLVSYSYLKQRQSLSFIVPLPYSLFLFSRSKQSYCSS